MRPRSLSKAAGIAASTLLAVSLTGPAQAVTSDPLRAEQWGLDQIQAETAWTTSRGEGVIVAVVDSGVDLTHPDLRANLVPGITTVVRRRGRRGGSGR